MSMSDPIADMLTRIRNGQTRGRVVIEMPASRQKIAIANLLREEGYLGDVSVSDDAKPLLRVALKYYRGRPVIEFVERVSRPGLRIYRGKDSLPKVRGGLGIAVISTSHGLVTDRVARESGWGGEVIALVA